MKNALRIFKKIVLWGLIAFFGSSIFFTLLYKWVPVYISPLMVIRCVQQSGRDEPTRLHHNWVPLDSISPHLVEAVMASEDQRFLEHSGFDIDAIKQAARENSEGKRRRGASTISQQTAKNVFLWPASSWVRKGFEAYFTILIELLWSKERIMEVYLNTIEMGDGIYGAQAVAEQHFGTTALNLNKKQCALIAASLPNPLRFNSAAPSAYMSKRQRQIMRQMPYIRSQMKKHEFNE
ncbi:MAG: monofunctional biosynthetic peptidoglycan transglycosylase [Bacteroidaceae bacterium]|nr:monofunctional biosynthetic peptidoglycan transglycosylase [Bacteroidaceae bacterium]